MNRRVDRKLHLAELSLAAINADANAQAAFVDAAVFHLHIAYCAYLRELFEPFKLALTPDTAQAAATLLRTRDLRSGDIEELATLEHNGEWPAQLRKAYIAAANTDVARESIANTGNAHTGIALSDVTAQIDATACAVWLEAFRELLQRQRDNAQEW